ncbi:ABC transporter substrate-binding protein [Arthrobacter sp. 08Y14]|uniref:ABC transporter substrate-binding protein n=1 Tax=Arthrobacter sp. 08Y14 TaxID=2058885 RepID=UPI000CE326F5|nr:ABC transporter substrate-binding protein [Arthrobacter sp. 08Y14]
MNVLPFRGRRGLMVAAAATTTALILSGCGSEAGAGEAGDEPFRILVLGALSAEGALGINASTSVLAAQAGAQVANEDGGILGRDIEVEVADDQGDPTAAVTLVREAINSDTPPDAILNSGPSQVADATLPIINQAGILSFNIGPTETSLDPSVFPLNFDISAGPSHHVAGQANHFEEMGYTSVGVLHGSSSYGESYGNLADEGFADGGMKVVGNEEYDVASLDMTPQLEALRAKNPDVLALDAYGAPLGYILQGLEKLGWDVPVVGNVSVAATGLVNTPPPSGVLGTEQVENLVMEVYRSTVYNPDAEVTNRAVEAMLSIAPIKATLILAYNYDAVMLLKAAAESVGSTDDPEALAAALEDPEVTKTAETAILNEYVFSADEHSPAIAGDEFQFIPPSAVKDGQFHVAK